jgi:hypothetical protein
VQELLAIDADLELAVSNELLDFRDDGAQVGFLLDVRQVELEVLVGVVRLRHLNVVPRNERLAPDEQADALELAQLREGQPHGLNVPIAGSNRDLVMADRDLVKDVDEHPALVVDDFWEGHKGYW